MTSSFPPQTTRGWTDSSHDGSLESFATKNGLISDALRSHMAHCDAVILPRNVLLGEAPEDTNVFPVGSKTLAALLRESGFDSELYSDGRERRELVLMSADVVLPIVAFIGSNAAAVGLGILSSWIYDRFIKGVAGTKPTIKVEYVRAERDGAVMEWRSVEGSADEVRHLLAKESTALAVEVPKSDLGRAYVPLPEPEGASRVDESKAKADETDAEAAELIKKAKHELKVGNRTQAEALFRQALGKLRQAVLWQQDSPQRSKELHRVGRLVHDEFGCVLDFRDGQYWVTCPVILSHQRFGFSIGGVGKAICSICGENAFDCPHMTGQLYDGITATRFSDRCNICREEKCEHKEGQVYDGARAIRVITEMDLDHISLVRNPANPMCVAHCHSIPESDVLKMLPPQERDAFQYGSTTLHCHHCLECTGDGEGATAQSQPSGKKGRVKQKRRRRKGKGKPKRRRK